MTLGTTKVNEGLGSISLVAYTDTAYLHLQIIIFFFHSTLCCQYSFSSPKEVTNVPLQ